MPFFFYTPPMTLTLVEWAIALPIGVFFSCLGTLVGLGGGVFMVPVLVLGFAVPLKTAIAAITFCLFPSALLSTFFNARAKQIDYFAGISLEIPTIIGAILGAALINVLPVRPLETMFAILVAIMGIKIFRAKTPNGKMSWLQKINQIPPVISREAYGVSYKAGLPAIGFFGLFSGTLAGLFGIGGGIIKTPVMLKIFKMPARRATSTALFMIVFTSATAAISHWQQGRLDWNLALPLGAAFFTGSLIGNNVVGKVKAHTLEKTLGFVMMAAAIAIIVHAWVL